MKQLKSCMLSILIFFGVIIGIVLVIISGFSLYDWIVTDETAYTHDGVLLLDGFWYEAAGGLVYEQGRFIAKTSDGFYNIFEVVGDPERNFVVIRGDNSTVMRREDYKWTTDEITRVGDSKDQELRRAMQEILTGDSETFSDTLLEYHTGSPVAIYYDHSPVGWYETVAYVQGKYVILDIDDERESNPIDDYKVAVRCKVIDEKHLPVLRKHLGGVLDAAVAEAKVREEQTSSP